MTEYKVDVKEFSKIFLTPGFNILSLYSIGLSLTDDPALYTEFFRTQNSSHYSDSNFLDHIYYNKIKIIKNKNLYDFSDFNKNIFEELVTNIQFFSSYLYFPIKNDEFKISSIMKDQLKKIHYLICLNYYKGIVFSKIPKIENYKFLFSLGFYEGYPSLLLNINEEFILISEFKILKIENLNNFSNFLIFFDYNQFKNYKINLIIKNDNTRYLSFTDNYIENINFINYNFNNNDIISNVQFLISHPNYFYNQNLNSKESKKFFKFTYFTNRKNLYDFKLKKSNNQRESDVLIDFDKKLYEYNSFIAFIRNFTLLIQSTDNLLNFTEILKSSIYLSIHNSFARDLILNYIYYLIKTIKNNEFIKLFNNLFTITLGDYYYKHFNLEKPLLNEFVKICSSDFYSYKPKFFPSKSIFEINNEFEIIFKEKLSNFQIIFKNINFLDSFNSNLSEKYSINSNLQ